MNMAEDEVYKDGKYEIKYDDKYGYRHLFPIPSRDELEQYYEKEFYGANYDKQVNDSSKKVQEEESEFIAMQYEDIIEIAKQVAPGNKIIDIGCGQGNFLKFCQDRGFEVFGLDPSPEAVKNALSLGVPAVKSDIKDLKNNVSKKYDVAALLNVLEHLRQPAEVLKDIKENILNDNGLLIVKVPNEFNKLQVIASQEYNLKSWWVSAPQHINYFTIPDLVNLINNHGFEVFLKEASFPLEMFILMGEQYVGNPKLGKAIHEKRVLFEKTLEKYDNNYKRELYRKFAEIGLGREVTVYARKNKI